jgi:hypothetical protein
MATGNSRARKTPEQPQWALAAELVDVASRRLGIPVSVSQLVRYLESCRVAVPGVTIAEADRNLAEQRAFTAPQKETSHATDESQSWEP